MRLFLAIELPEAVKRHVSDVQNSLQTLPELSDSMRWTPVDNLHITLKFLGDVCEGSVDRLISLLSPIEVQPIRLMADRIIGLPQRGPLRIVGVGIGGEPERLEQLVGDIEAACEAFGVERERRPFLAHVTVGRSRIGHRRGSARSLWETAGERFPGPAFDVGAFSLIQSVLSEHGPRYERLHQLTGKNS